jgi:hypothetical protein
VAQQSATPSKNSVAALATYAPSSSHILIGDAQKRRISTSGIEYAHQMLSLHHYDIDYVVMVAPYFRENDPSMVATTWVDSSGLRVTTPMNPVRVIKESNTPIGSACGGGSSCSSVYPVYGKGLITHGFLMSPVGSRVYFDVTRRVRPTLESSIGMLLTGNDVPIDYSSEKNFVFNVGLGLEVRASARISVRAAYLYRHISNANSGLTNPGIDQGVFQLSLSQRK